MNDSTGSPLSPELRTALEAEIDPNERVIWMGTPLPSRVRAKALRPCRIGGGVLIFVGLVLLGAACSVLWEIATVPREQMTSRRSLADDIAGITIMTLFIGGALGTGGYLAFVLPGRLERRARRTAYALTPTRLLRVQCSDGREPSVESFEPSHPLHIGRRHHPDGTGDVVVAPRFSTQVAAREPGGVGGGGGAIMLEAIHDARAVDRLIRVTFDPPRTGV